jgi:tRNA (guanine-N7-)-methyltransferase
MGRRALRKINSSIDLTGHLKTVDQLPRPWNAEALFGRTAPLEVEVGSGKGLFLRNAATARPDVDFLGIEVARKYAQFAAAGLAKAGLHNALVVEGDALRVFQELLPDESLAAVHVYFPDPWWKQRHRRRRVMRESFLRDVQRTLRPGGSLHFWTDVGEYFETTLELLASCTALLGPLPVPEAPTEHDMAYRTHFERRVRKASEPVFRAEFKKEGLLTKTAAVCPATS